MGGSKAPDMTPQIAAQMGATQLASTALANKAELAKLAAGIIPRVSMPDISGQNQRILQQSIANAYQGRNVEKLLDPSAAAMREQLMPSIQKLTSPEATAARQNQWLKTSGLQRLFGSGTGLGTFGASALADAGTEQGFQNMLRNIQLQQGVLGAAPSVGVNPSSAASQIENARAQEAGIQNAFLQNILQQGSGLQNEAFQSGQNLSNAARQLAAQDYQNQYAARQSSGGIFGNMLGGAASGAATGMATGNPYAALILGGVGAGMGAAQSY